MKRAVLLLAVMGAAVLLASAGVALAQTTQPQSAQAQRATPLAPLKEADQDPIPDRYIVVLKNDGSDPEQVAEEKVQEQGITVEHTYERVLKGFSAEIPPSQLDEVRKDPRVQSVSQDFEVRAVGSKHNK